MCEHYGDADTRGKRGLAYPVVPDDDDALDDGVGAELPGVGQKGREAGLGVEEGHDNRHSQPRLHNLAVAIERVPAAHPGRSAQARLGGHSHSSACVFVIGGTTASKLALQTDTPSSAIHGSGKSRLHPKGTHSASKQTQRGEWERKRERERARARVRTLSA